MARKYQKKPSKHLKLAKEHIHELFRQASLAEEQRYRNRYVYLARRIAMKFKLRLTSEQKRHICKHCYSYLTSENSTRRLKDKVLNIKCKACGKYYRIPYK